MARIRKENGQSLVELGITFLFLMLLLSGAAEFGIAFFQVVQLRDAAQEGALYGSALEIRDTVSIEDRIRGASSSPINLTSDDVQVSLFVNGGSKTLEQSCEGDGLKVSVAYPHKIFMPFLPKLLGVETITLRGEVVNTILRPVCD